MRLQRRPLALAGATAVLTATGLFAATGYASADHPPSHNPGMTRMHELKGDGNPGMGRMHEQMMTGSGMHCMHRTHQH